MVASGLRVRFTQSIRFRLLLTFLLVGILPVILIATISAINQWQTGRANAVRQLEMLASLKQAQLEDWLRQLEDQFQEVVENAAVADYGRVILFPATETGVGADLLNEWRMRLNRYTGRGLFNSYFLMDINGVMVFISQGARERWSFREAPFFQAGLVTRSIYLVGDRIVVVEPLRDAAGRPFGVFGGYADVTRLNEIIGERTVGGEQFESYLVNEEYVAFSGIGSPELRIAVNTLGAIEAIKGRSGNAIYPNYRGDMVIGVYRWLPSLQSALLVEVKRADAYRQMWVGLLTNVLVGVLMVGIAAMLALLTTRQIARPIAGLVQTAQRIAAGERELDAKVERADEIGALGQAFNSMTTQLRELVNTLEARVEERTRTLAQRTAYLEATAEVGRVVSSILDLDRLRGQIAELIRERFGLYYVGLFQVDESGEWAVLQAGTGEYGRKMLARGHRIRIGEGMVGWCIANDRPRVTADVPLDPLRIAPEELPNTRSEAAIPLRAQGRVVGALSVQSEQVNAFGEDILFVLQTMADQVAVAITNARLFAQVQEALEAARRAYGELSRRAWIDLLHGGGQVAFRSDELGVMRLEPISAPEIEQALREGRTIIQSAADASRSQVHRTRGGSTLTIPIRVGEEVIGVLNTFKPIAQGEWTAQEVAWLEDVTEQLSFALEAARFYQQTQLREMRERQIREINTNLQARVSLDALMQSAIAELARVLNVPSAFVQLSTQSRAEE